MTSREKIKDKTKRKKARKVTKMREKYPNYGN